MFLFQPGFSQVKEYIIKHTTPVREADFNTTNDADLLPIEKAIGNKRIVMLGELYHGDGEELRLKSRLVRYLHEHMGFNVIAFESDFFSLNHGWEAFKKNKISLDSLLYLSVFPVWTQCMQANDLFQYINNNAGKLRITGFDNRGISGYGMRHLKRSIDGFLREQQVSFTTHPSYNTFITAIGRTPWILNGNNREALDSLLKLMPIVIEQVSDPFYLHVLKGLLINYTLALHYRYNKERKDHPQHDFQMAENLKWLASDKFANEKIIIWAHNSHVEKGPLENVTHRSYNSMGYYFSQDPQLAAQTYTIGLTCYEGTGGLTISDVTEKVTKPHKKSIESWIHSMGYPYAFTDLTFQQEEDLYYMKTYINTASELPWKKFYDGILYVREAKPCLKK
ncbi:erythromycin esterase family protein [Chitinophaga niabensis]|uniref:erythromycin esterase family protein n=1 Tax=Chitinophaga niabensis TaxID=536979 RepID=UPI0031BABCDA